MRRSGMRIGATLLALAAAPAGAGDAPILEFHLRYLPVHGRRMESVFYDCDGDGGADLIQLSIDLDKDPPERWIAVHLRRRGEFADRPDWIWSVSDRACAIVFGDFLPGGETEVGFVAEDGVYAYPWRDGAVVETPVKLFHGRTFFRSPSFRQLPVWWWRTDLDGDRRDDLLVPLADGYRVLFQTAPGVFGRTAALEADLPAGVPRALGSASHADRPELVAAHLIRSTELPRVQAVDINGDGRLMDLVTIRNDTITYYFQKEPGVFPSHRPFRFSFSVGTLREEVRKGQVNLAMIRFVDIDKDDIADLVVTRIEGQLGLWESIKTGIYLHRGTGRGNFSPDKVIRIDGVSIDPDFVDMNGDGKLDAVTSRLRTDLIKQGLNAFVLGDIQISYEIFQYDPAERRFFDDPVYEWPVLVPRADLEKTGAGAVPLIYIRGDLTGDRRPDLVMVDPKLRNDRQSLTIHPGRIRETTAGPRINFDRTAHYEVLLDRFPKGLAVSDVNGDGINDVVLYHAGALGLVLSRKR